jgi:hypothetical protein
MVEYDEKLVSGIAPPIIPFCRKSLRLRIPLPQYGEEKTILPNLQDYRFQRD